MTRKMSAIAGAGLFTLAAVLSGCGGSDVEEGVPKDVGYVPPRMQPGTLTSKEKPKLGATEKDKADAKAAAGATPAPSP